MNIYPYVYRLDHPETGEFYIGYRCGNKVPAEEDLGSKYFTSSKYVKPRFHEFNITILAEFFDKDSAYDFEQQLIYENFKNQNILNKSCYHNKPHFTPTAESLLRSAIAAKGRKWSKESKEKFSKYKKSESHLKALSDALKGNKLSKQTKNKISISKTGVPVKKLVCRIFDKKEMSLHHFNQWINKQYKNTLNIKVVCRLSDKREITLQHFNRYPI